jgi:hypothetical protein
MSGHAIAMGIAIGSFAVMTVWLFVTEGIRMYRHNLMCKALMAEPCTNVPMSHNTGADYLECEAIWRKSRFTRLTSTVREKA